MGGLSGVTDTESTALFYYVGNIVLDISGISTKVSYDNMWRSHFCSYVGNINESTSNALLYSSNICAKKSKILSCTLFLKYSLLDNKYNSIMSTNLAYNIENGKC